MRFTLKREDPDSAQKPREGKEDQPESLAWRGKNGQKEGPAARMSP